MTASNDEDEIFVVNEDSNSAVREQVSFNYRTTTHQQETINREQEDLTTTHEQETINRQEDFDVRAVSKERSPRSRMDSVLAIVDEALAILSDDPGATN